MKNICILSAILLCGFLTSCACCGGKTKAQTGPLALFNGKDLSGWEAFLVEPEVKQEDVWSVKEGLLICKGEPLGYLATKGSYTNFRLIVEWRWAPGAKPGNSGVLMRLNGEPQGLPRSIEAQLKSGDAGDLYAFHGMKIDGDAARRIEVKGHQLGGDLTGVKKREANENPPGEWNRYEIVLNGSSLVVSVNGKPLNEATGCEVVSGPIALQSEGGVIQFRTVELTPLMP